MRKIKITVLFSCLILSCSNEEKWRVSTSQVNEIKKNIQDYISLSKESNKNSSLVEYDYVPSQDGFSIGDYEGHIDSLEKFGDLSKQKTRELILIIKKMSNDGLSGIYYYDNIPLYFSPYKRTYKEESIYENRYLSIVPDSVVNGDDFKFYFEVIDKKEGVYLLQSSRR